MSADVDYFNRWQSWARAQLADVVVRERLSVGCAEVRQGPLTVMFRLRLLAPNKTDLARLLALGPTIGQALQVAGVRVTAGDAGVIVETPSPTPITPSASWLAKHTTGLSVAIGVDSQAQPVVVDLAQVGHLAVIGPTRKGKTQAVRSLLYALASRNRAHDLTMIVMAKKAASWRLWAPVAHCYGVLSDDDDIVAALHWLVGVVDSRSLTGVRSPAVVVVVDDLRNVATRSHVTDSLDQIASMGAEAGVHLVLATQSTGVAGGLSQAVEANLTRLVYGAPDAAMAARFAGRAGVQADQVGTTPGDALLITPGAAVRVATGRCGDDLVAQLPAGPMPTPWRTGANRCDAAPTRPTGADADRPGAGAEPVAEPVRHWPRTGPISDAEWQAVSGLLTEYSKNEACRRAYGAKTATAWQRINRIAAGTRDAVVTGDETVIDLTTDAGRRTFADLSASNLIGWHGRKTEGIQ